MLEIKTIGCGNKENHHYCEYLKFPDSTEDPNIFGYKKKNIYICNQY